MRHGCAQWDVVRCDLTRAEILAKGIEVNIEGEVL